MRPGDAEFGITIEYVRGESSPLDVFAAMTELLEATSEIDRLFVGSIEPQVEPVLILEDVQAESVTVWVRNKIAAIDDTALREFDPKQQVGKYAVKAKYRVLRYLDEQVEKQERQRLEKLRDDLVQIAGEAGATLIPHAAPIPLPALTKPMDRIQKAKETLGSQDRVTVRSEEEDYVLDTTVTKRPSEFVGPEAVRTEQTTVPMTLTIKRPDLLGSAMWEFRHGPQAIQAHIEDADWMEAFRAGRIAILPGTALRCDVSQAFGYDERGELVTSSYGVVHVHEMIDPSPPPPTLFDA